MEDHRFSQQLTNVLRAAGWFPNRQTDAVVTQLDFLLHTSGQVFFREFGGLAIGGTIFTDSEYINMIYRDRRSLDPINLPTILPVGLSWFWCEGELWMDDLGRVYQAGDHELVLVSEKVEEALEILVIRGPKIPDNAPKWAIEPKPPNPFDLGVSG